VIVARAAISRASKDVTFAERTTARISASSDGTGPVERDESGVVVLLQLIQEDAFATYAPVWTSYA
jgi:hypothetical protein